MRSQSISDTENGQAPTASARLRRAALLEACRKSDFDEILSIAGEGYGLDHHDGFGATPLTYACASRNEKLASFLLFLGADPSKPDKAGWTPAHWCCRQGFEPGLVELIEFGAQYSFDGPEKLSPAHFCAIYPKRSLGCATIIRSKRPQWAEDARSGAAPVLHGAAGRLDVCLALMPDAMELHPLDARGRGALHWCVKQSRSDGDAIKACSQWIANHAKPIKLFDADDQGIEPWQLARSKGYGLAAAFLLSVKERSSLSGWIHPEEEQRTKRL